MTTQLIIALQLILVLLIAAIMLSLMLLRQKKTIEQLKQILTNVKDDLSGENLTGYMAQEMDNTTAHCKQETIALKPELGAEDMAISLRYLVLETELGLIKNYDPETPTAWRVQIKPYIELATLITDLIKARVDNATLTLNQSHNQEIGEKQSEIDKLQLAVESLAKQVAALSPLENLFLQPNDQTPSKIELEQQLHKALLSLCENYANSENIREIIFLIHESFNAAQLQQPTEEATAETTKPE